MPGPDGASGPLGAVVRENRARLEPLVGVPLPGVIARHAVRAGTSPATPVVADRLVGGARDGRLAGAGV